MAVSPLGTNCYLVYDRQSGDGVVIDPGDEAERIAAKAIGLRSNGSAIGLRSNGSAIGLRSNGSAIGLRSNGSAVGCVSKWHAVILTHGHADHVSAAGRLKRLLQSRTDVAPIIYIHPADGDYLKEYNALVAPQMGIDYEYFAGDAELTDGMTIECGSITVRVLHTPGHSAGSTSVMVDDNLFAGDLLFKGSVGRTDLPGGSWDVLRASLKRVLEALPPETTVYPGHGEATTLTEEIKYNPFVREALE